MSNKYPVQDRMREMSKQEEILLKRKREIERKMKEQRQAEARQTKAPPLPKMPAPVTATVPSTAFSSATSGSVPNKFSNDGSFFEQFKKMAKLKTEIKTDIKEEIVSYPSSPPAKHKAFSQVPPPRQWSPPRSPPEEKRPRFSTSSSPELHKVKTEYEPIKLKTEYEAAKIKTEYEPIKLKTEYEAVKLKTEYEAAKLKTEFDNEERGMAGGSGGKGPDHPDWFKDALKRAQEKAKQLSATTPAGFQEDDNNSSDADIPLAKKKRSRWGESPPPAPVQESPPPPVVNSNPTSFGVPESLMGMVGEGEHFEAIHGVMVTRMTRSNPAIYAYAQKVFGSTDLTEAQWKQCEEQMKMNVVFQLLQAKKRESERLERQGKVKYEYDSDEDTEGGTWEHKRRIQEMAETQAKAAELTSMAEGKHHIGDFLPPDELARFMEKYRAIKEGRDPDLSDYQQHKLTEDNVGYRMLKSMGWTEGMGLGAEGKGITTPVNQNGRNESQGLGVERPDNLNEDDDEYDAYRKRMMLAYRFRPNPLNNPRRQYY